MGKFLPSEFAKKSEKSYYIYKKSFKKLSFSEGKQYVQIYNICINQVCSKCQALVLWFYYSTELKNKNLKEHRGGGGVLVTVTRTAIFHPFWIPWVSQVCLEVLWVCLSFFQDWLVFYRSGLHLFLGLTCIFSGLAQFSKVWLTFSGWAQFSFVLHLFMSDSHFFPAWYPGIL